MALGGKRPGAGRKNAMFRNPDAMKTATDLIDKAQPRAVKALLDALEATKEFPKMIGRDDKGKPEYEYVMVPDHYARVKAAIALLAKRIPDLAHTTLAGDKESPIQINLTKEDADL